MKKYFLLLFLAACSGAVDSGGPGGSIGAPGTGNFAEGTLSSQAGIQELADECIHPYVMRFKNDVISKEDVWYIIQSEQKYFSSPALIVRDQKEPLVDEEICSNCAGRVVRLVDFGDPGFKPFQEKQDFILFSVAIRKHFVKPELIAQAVYQDFVVGNLGEVNLKDLPIQANHLYFFLLSNKTMAPVAGATSLQNAEDFYDMSDCSNRAEDQPFTWLRMFQARMSAPGSLQKIPQDNEIQLESLKEKAVLQVPSSEINSAGTPEMKGVEE